MTGSFDLDQSLSRPCRLTAAEGLATIGIFLGPDFRGVLRIIGVNLTSLAAMPLFYSTETGPRVDAENRGKHQGTGSSKREGQSFGKTENPIGKNLLYAETGFLSRLLKILGKIPRVSLVVPL